MQHSVAMLSYKLDFAGNPTYATQHLTALLPYKLLYAAHLAEHGFLSEAAQYCGAVQQGLGAVPKLPQGLAVCRSFTQDLLDRIQTHAAVTLCLDFLQLTLCIQ